MNPKTRQQIEKDAKMDALMKKTEEARKAKITARRNKLHPPPAFLRNRKNPCDFINDAITSVKSKHSNSPDNFRYGVGAARNVIDEDKDLKWLSILDEDELEFEFNKTFAFDAIRIHWCGNSWADLITLSASHHTDEVITTPRKPMTITPESKGFYYQGNFNRVTTIACTGGMEGQTFVMGMRQGHLDFYHHRYKFSVRYIEFFGRKVMSWRKKATSLILSVQMKMQMDERKASVESKETKEKKIRAIELNEDVDELVARDEEDPNRKFPTWRMIHAQQENGLSALGHIKVNAQSKDYVAAHRPILESKYLRAKLQQKEQLRARKMGDIGVSFAASTSRKIKKYQPKRSSDHDKFSDILPNRKSRRSEAPPSQETMPTPTTTNGEKGTSSYFARKMRSMVRFVTGDARFSLGPAGPGTGPGPPRDSFPGEEDPYVTEKRHSSKGMLSQSRTRTDAGGEYMEEQEKAPSRPAPPNAVNAVSDDALPPGWAAFEVAGKRFYRNEAQGTKQWERPTLSGGKDMFSTGKDSDSRPRRSGGSTPGGGVRARIISAIN